ncbi:TetR/AcrR family transcriptional regulator [Shewanella livingstonensis]|uniref:TetR/AcrR family transcriptional regulator n=1 Tax=Shewanella livingstonensis TaxID=150120 RepID=A0A3G8LP64_9GAMM|nr:TetR/AcrR family transcriptional regulator [Shewanella livingstonensis]AZG71321.1 TetR/AcrR family transcriptional regulator [Shewanella livingstonensis]
MSSWEERGNYLIEVSQRCLKGHKTFDLCRSHLVQASQISKGTIYNHFTSEADLIVAVASADYRYWLIQAEQDTLQYSDPYLRFIFHHCQRLYRILSEQSFVIARVIPNESILIQASDYYRERFEQIINEYQQWNQHTLAEIGVVAGFDRYELLKDYLRGALINSDDAKKHPNDAEMYYQFSFAMTQLMGHSHKRMPTIKVFLQWLDDKAV